MDDEVQKSEPKISLVIGILGLIVCIIMDALSLIPAVGDVEEVPAVIVLILSAIFGLGAPIIGVQVVADLLKAIPALQELPLWTPAWLFIWWLENSKSKTAQLGQAALSAAAVAEGDAEELGEAGAEAAESAEALEEAAATAEASEEAATEAAQAAETDGGATAEKAESQEGTAEKEKEEGSGDQNKKDKEGDIELGDEVEPEEQAAGEDFELPDSIESEDQDDDEDE